MAAVSADLAEQGLAIFRFDRRGVGDSMGDDPGFAGSGPDLAAALATFRQECPSIERIIGVGNCDAACALLLSAVSVDALVLTNVWLERDAANGASALPPSAIRRRYLARLSRPAEWLRLVRGGVDLGKLMSGVLAAVRPAGPTALTGRLAQALASSRRPTTILLAEHDATGIAFADALRRAPLKAFADRLRVRVYSSRSHSFATSADRALLVDAIVAHATT